MFLHWFSPARIVWSTFLGVNLLAVGLGFTCPPPSPYRQIANERIVALDPVHRRGQENTLHFFSPADERMVTIPIPESEGLDCLSISPWRDEAHKPWVVGRWRHWEGRGSGRRIGRVGIARLNWPDGEILDRIDSEIMPTSPPCWYPDERAKNLFASGDGRLYSLDWEAAKVEVEPVGLPAELERSFIREIVWPDRRSLGGLALATVFSAHAREHRLEQSRIWWMRFSEDGRRVEAAGPVFREGEAPAAAEDNTCDRWPDVATRPDGSRLLVYQFQPSGRIDCELRMVPLEIDPAQQAPRADRRRSIPLVESCWPNPTGGSPDGRWLAVVTRTGPNPEATRVAVPALLPLPSIIGNTDLNRLFAKVPLVLDRIGSLTFREPAPRVQL